MVLQFMLKKDFLLHGTYLYKTLHIFTYAFNWLYFTQCLTSFSCINHLLYLCAQILMRFSRSTHMQTFLSLETLMSIIRTDLPIWMQLIDLVNSTIIFLSQMTLLRWLPSLLGSQTVILTVLVFWIYLFLMPIFVLQ